MWGGISLWFWFAFSWWLVMVTIFSCLYWPFVLGCFFLENVYLSPLPICFCLWVCVSAYMSRVIGAHYTRSSTNNATLKKNLLLSPFSPIILTSLAHNSTHSNLPLLFLSIGPLYMFLDLTLLLLSNFISLPSPLWSLSVCF